MIGHRGAAACAPENTLVGFRRAKALGCGWVEFDVRLTADGAVILLHDDGMVRTTDGGGRASALPLSAIRRCDAGGWFDRSFAGERVPTLEEAVAVLAELGLGANVEVKAARGRGFETGAVVAESLARLWPAPLPVVISSFLPEALAAARAHAPQIARGQLFRSVPRDWRARAEAEGCSAIHADQRLLRPAIVAEIVNSGYSVLAYTVNDAGRARTLFGWGVVSVFSDVPHIVLADLADAADPSGAAASGSAETARPGAVW